MKKKRLERYREGLLQPPRFLFPSIARPPLYFTDLFLPDDAEHLDEHICLSSVLATDMCFIHNFILVHVSIYSEHAFVRKQRMSYY
jgi:hypothetical protein